MKYFNILGIIAMLFALTACHHVEVKNKVFFNLDPSSKEYKEELVKQIKTRHPTEFTYIFNDYISVGGRDYLNVKINATGMEAECNVLVKHWNKLEDLRKTNGMGYSGAELKNLKLEIVNGHNGPAFIYKGLDSIVD